MIPETRLVGNMALLPLKTQFKGPARGDGKAWTVVFSEQKVERSHLDHINTQVMLCLFSVNGLFTDPSQFFL